MDDHSNAIQLQSITIASIHTLLVHSVLKIAGNSSGTRFLEVPLGDFPFLPEPLQPRFDSFPAECIWTCSLNGAVLPTGVIGCGETGHGDKAGMREDVTKTVIANSTIFLSWEEAYSRLKMREERKED
ncbi:hypothetical protein TNCV_5120191 [Trichonephila clavipes]|nr:hypothetical protein TNCV_5120191 [Trichonephila clavipes]